MVKLQRSRGNQAVQRLVKERTRPGIQPKLDVGRPDDAYEREADRVAEHVLRMPEPARRPSRTSGGTRSATRGAETPPVQRKVTASEGGPAGLSRGNVVPSSGHPLDRQTRTFFEPRFGHDFGDVRVHAGPEASRLTSSLQARAYTVGRDIVFGEEQYQPREPAGRRLLAHELTHVVQQRSGGGEEIQRQSIHDPRFPCGGTSDLPGGLEDRWRTGTAIHLLIQQHYVSNIDPLAATEYVFPGSGPLGGRAQADLVDSTGGIYEIVPLGQAQRGYNQLTRRLTSAEANCNPAVNWHPGWEYWAPPMQVEGNLVYSWLMGPGLIVYTRNRRERERQEQPQEQPQEAPQGTWALVAEWARRVYEEGLDATEAAKEFLRQHPELVHVIAAAGIGAIIGLIADDATLAGIADDVLIPIIARLEWVALRFSWAAL